MSTCAGDAAAYVLGALEPDEAEAFRQHLAECAVCRDEVEALGGVVKALPMSAPQHPVPRRLRRRILRAIREEPRRQPVTRAWSSSWRGAAVVAAAAVAAVVVVIAVSSGGSSGRVINAQVSGITGTAQLRLSHGQAELSVRHMPPPPAGHVYEVWLKAPKANPVPASVLFSVGANGSADVGLPQNLHGISQVMVTPEPSGGSAAPTHSPVIVAQLS